MKSESLKLYQKSTKAKQLIDLLTKPNTKIHAKGLIGSSVSFLIQQVFEQTQRPILLLVNDKEEAAYLTNDLEKLVNDKDVHFFPGSFKRPYQIEEVDNANVLLRAEVLNRINAKKKHPKNGNWRSIVY